MLKEILPNKETQGFYLFHSYIFSEGLFLSISYAQVGVYDE